MSPISTGTDAYSWIGSSGGSWGDASNWKDVTAGTSPATSAPGSKDPVTIAGTSGSAPLVVSGGGSSASLGLTGNVALSGTYQSGALSLGSAATTTKYGSSTISYTAGTLGVGAGSVVNATTVKLVDGTATLSGSGAGLSASGVVTVGSPSQYTGSVSTSGQYSTLQLAAGASLAAATTVALANGNLTLDGSGTTATLKAGLTIGTAPTTSTTSGGTTFYGSGGSLSLTNGAKATVAGAIAENEGSLSVSGTGSSLVATGGLTVLTNAYGGLSASYGGSVQLGTLVIKPLTTTSSYGSGSGVNINVDGSSKVEIGTAGTAASGTLQVDAGKTITATTSAFLSASNGIVDNGLISETGGTLTLGGALKGAGKVQIGANSTAVLNGTASSTNTLAFAGAGAALEIGTTYGYNSSTGSYSQVPYAVSSTLSGFATGDSIVLDKTAVSSATYASTGTNAGTLTLKNGSTTIETLKLAGADYTGRTFAVSPTSNGGSVVTLNAAGSTASASPAVQSKAFASPAATQSSVKTVDVAPNRTTTAGGPSETFVFNPHMGHEIVSGFQAGGGGHDVLDLSSTAFTSLADVLRHTTMSGSDAVIQVSDQDMITLQNVSVADLKANRNDFRFQAS